MEDQEAPSGQNDKTIQITENERRASCGEIGLAFISYLFVAIFFPFSLFFCIKIIHEFERAVVFRLGHLRKKDPLGPGVIFVLPCIDRMETLDIRMQSVDVPQQEVITKDAVTVLVDAVVHYRIVLPLVTVLKVDDFETSFQYITQATLREIIGLKDLSDLLTLKGDLSKFVAETLNNIIDAWGVEVERVEIKDVTLPEGLQRSMAAEAEAICEARAKIVAAEGELSSSRALKEASDIMAASPIALQLKYLQTLSIISSDTNSTVIFPFPMELMDLGASAGTGKR